MELGGGGASAHRGVEMDGGSGLHRGGEAGTQLAVEAGAGFVVLAALFVIGHVGAQRGLEVAFVAIVGAAIPELKVEQVPVL